MSRPNLPLSESSINRRRLLVGSAAVGAGWLLAACGSDSTASTTSAAPAPSAAFPVTIEGQLGTVELASRPERIVSVGTYRDTDAAVAFGVVPLASPDLSFFMEGGMSPWVLRELAATRPELYDTESLPFEAIAAMKPDLILATDLPSLDEDYALLSAIAPTLSYVNGYNRDEWQLTTRRVGAALGQAARAEELISEVDAVVAAARDANPQFAGTTFTFGPVTADGTVNTINSTTDASVVFLSSLGLELSPSVVGLPQGAFPGRSVISPERLDLLDADVIMLTYNSPEARATMEANPIFQQLPAVQRGAYVALDLPVAIALGFPSALSIPYGVEQVVPKLAEALGS